MGALMLRTLVSGARAEFSLLQVKQAEPNIDLWMTTQQLRIYSDSSFERRSKTVGGEDDEEHI
jgi:hypothetical protein